MRCELDNFKTLMLPSLKDAEPADAADNHTHRRDRIDTRLEPIQKHLDLTRARRDNHHAPLLCPFCGKLTWRFSGDRGT
jgi:hypothetical protein